jgi:ketosteroid isomerase-like protein
MKRLLAIITLGLALIIASCNQAKPPADPKLLEDMAIAWDEALNSGDLDTLTMFYAGDARILPPNGETLRGAEGVREAFGAIMDAGLSGKTSIVELSMSGALAHKIGTYQLTDGDTVVDSGKFIETWRRGDDDKWRITNDIWNSDLPAAPPKPAMHGMHRRQGGMMGHQHVMIQHEVEDAERWLAAWRGEDSRHDMFRANGAAHVHTFQSADDPNLTGLVIAVKDMEAFRNMLSSDEGRAAAAEDGVVADSMTVLTETK